MAATARILVAHGMLRPPPLFECGLLASRCIPDRVYRIDPVAAANLADIERCCHGQAPRVLLLDAGLLGDTGAADLQHLRRRWPATEFLLGWDAPACNGGDIAVLRQVRGCVGWAVSATHLARALDAVVAGETWFPRSVLEHLYRSLLEAGAPGSAAGSAIGCGAPLTVREDEVRALMRHGMTNRQIAERLEISVNTVKKHLGRVFEKNGLHGRRQELA